MDEVTETISQNDFQISLMVSKCLNWMDMKAVRTGSVVESNTICIIYNIQIERESTHFGDELSVRACHGHVNRYGVI